jgi:ribosome-associated protein
MVAATTRDSLAPTRKKAPAAKRKAASSKSPRPGGAPRGKAGKAGKPAKSARPMLKTSTARRTPSRVRSAATGDGTPAPARRDTRAAETLARAAIDAALDKKALLPVLIDVSAMASYTDFIGIVSGRSDRQVDAIAEAVRLAMKERGRSLLGQEGTGSGRWTLLDFGDVVVHVFYHPVREFYDLESLWGDAPRLPMKIPPEAVISQPDALYGNP